MIAFRAIVFLHTKRCKILQNGRGNGGQGDSILLREGLEGQRPSNS